MLTAIKAINNDEDWRRTVDIARVCRMLHGVSVVVSGEMFVPGLRYCITASKRACLQ